MVKYTMPEIEVVNVETTDIMNQSAVQLPDDEV